MSRPKTAAEKRVNLRVGQRVRIIHHGDQFTEDAVGCIADVTQVTDEKVYFYVALPDKNIVEQVYSITHPAHLMSIADDDHPLALLKRMRGKPYVPLLDPPRAMGARKRKKKLVAPPVSAALAAITWTHPPTGEPSPMKNPSATTAAPTASTPPASATAGALADLVSDHTYDRILKTLRPWQDNLATNIEVRLHAFGETMDKKMVELTEMADAAAPVVVSAAAVTARTGSKKREASTLTADPNPIVSKLASFYSPGVEAPANVLLTSPPSFGKSYAIRSLGAAYDVFLEHGCSDDMDEISTLLGSPIPDGKGSFVVVDGVLTEAVRAAARGKTVLLLLDEVLRLTPRAQEWLLTFLTGVKQPDGTRTYRLRTRRAMPDGTLEVLECMTSHLHIVGATNLSILAPIEAFWSRWETVRVEFSPEMAQATAVSILASYGIKDPRKKLAKAWAGIVRDTRNVVGDGKLRFPADFRMLERAAALAPDGAAASVAAIACDRLTDNIANWNPDTGDVSPESLAIAQAWTKKLSELANGASKDDTNEKEGDA